MRIFRLKCFTGELYAFGNFSFRIGKVQIRTRPVISMLWVFARLDLTSTYMNMGQVIMTRKGTLKTMFLCYYFFRVCNSPSYKRIKGGSSSCL